MHPVDVFNGDADGICALHQLRLASPVIDKRSSTFGTLVTGVKRDINLLARLHDLHGQSITVLDISLDKNRKSLDRLLDQDNRILYVDHHYSGDIPEHPNLEVHIDPDPMVCTSIIIDRLLEGDHRPWAVVGAFGDNLDESAEKLARSCGLGGKSLTRLKETGILLNYNGYGASLEDLFFHPAKLYRLVHEYEDPLEFHATSPAIQILRRGYQDDMERAVACEPFYQSPAGRLYELPSEPWARRVAGVFSNTLARERTDLAHGILTRNSDQTYRVSIRAPLTRRSGADTLCRRFPTGGGRAAAAGINQLNESLLDRFIQDFDREFSPQEP
ncbi:acetyltransferase [Desulfolithobacter sp.]